MYPYSYFVSFFLRRLRLREEEKRGDIPSNPDRRATSPPAPPQTNEALVITVTQRHHPL